MNYRTLIGNSILLFIDDIFIYDDVFIYDLRYRMVTSTDLKTRRAG